ncbi:unnamed protein product [Parajaminaea phylloscopi]
MSNNGRNGAKATREPFGPNGPFGIAFQIIPGVQNEDWGLTSAQGSLVALYAQATDQLEIEIAESKRYAELWMGTHPSLPATIVPPPNSPKVPGDSKSFISLSSYLNRHQSLLGEHVVAKHGTGLTRNAESKGKDQGALPFLLKVLSAGRALSIQAHPDVDLARRLHQENPEVYKDGNAKPKMAIALTPFRGFKGFRPLAEIVQFLQVVPELHYLVDPSDAFLNELDYASKQPDSTSQEETRDYLRRIFGPLMRAAATLVKKSAMGIAQRYAGALREGKAEGLEVGESLAKLVCMLNRQFPGDVGIFCAFVLNLVTMQPGQAMYLEPNELHAYISGNIVECMASSDNVVRAGLTAEERDVDVLVDMLAYKAGEAGGQLIKPRPFPASEDSPNYSAYEEFSSETELPEDVASPTGAERDDKEARLPSLLYKPPTDVFAVAVTRLRSGEQEVQRPIDGPSILVVTSGRGTVSVSAEGGEKRVEFEVEKAGKVFFVGAGGQVQLKAAGTQDAGEENLSVFRAFTEV